MSDEKKIVVDEDWKAQVEAEKEKLQEKNQSQKSPEGAGGRTLPLPSFQLHISNLATQALMFLGQFPNPITQKQEIRLEEARHVIDTLAILDEKTRGNLDAEEAQMMEGVLHELRMGYVTVKELVAKQTGGGAQSPGGVDLPGGGSAQIELP